MNTARNLAPTAVERMVAAETRLLAAQETLAAVLYKRKRTQVARWLAERVVPAYGAEARALHDEARCEAWVGDKQVNAAFRAVEAAVSELRAMRDELGGCERSSGEYATGGLWS